MSDIIALIWGIGFGCVGIYLYVKEKLGQKPLLALSLLLTFTLGGGIAIGYRERLIHFKGLGIEIETIRKEINQEKTTAINDIKQEATKQRKSINLVAQKTYSVLDNFQKQFEAGNRLGLPMDANIIQRYKYDLENITAEEIHLDPNR